MGNQRSRPPQEPNAPSAIADGKQTDDAPPSTAALPTVVGVPDDADCLVTAYPALARAVCQEVPSTLRESWRLLYSSSVDGRSFPKFVRCICNAGPTLILVRQLAASGDCLIIGGFNTCMWRTELERAGAAKFANGGGGGPGALPKGRQNPLFFGDERCFALVATASSEPSQTSLTSVTIHRGSTRSNANFMYLCDGHAPSQRTGIGMGGRPGCFGWFIDEMMAQCYCQANGCTTFEPAFHVLPQSFPSEGSGDRDADSAGDSFPIAVVEAYSLEARGVHPERQRELERRALVKRYAMDSAGIQDDDGKQISILRRGDAPTIRAVLELANAHQFRGDVGDDEHHPSGATCG